MGPLLHSEPYCCTMPRRETVKTVKLAALITSAFLLTACLPSAPSVYQKNHVAPVTGFEDLLMSTATPEPPEPETYLKSSRDEKEDILIRTYIEAFLAVQSCNLDKAAVKRIVEQANARINAFNLEEEKRAKNNGAK